MIFFDNDNGNNNNNNNIVIIQINQLNITQILRNQHMYYYNHK